LFGKSFNALLDAIGDIALVDACIDGMAIHPSYPLPDKGVKRPGLDKEQFLELHRVPRRPPGRGRNVTISRCYRGICVLADIVALKA
jgi:hypothetical protein